MNCRVVMELNEMQEAKVGERKKLGHVAPTTETDVEKRKERREERRIERKNELLRSA
jgi:hypothetical protein